VIHQLAHAALQVGLELGRERLWCEGRLVRIGRQRQVQFSGAPAEQSRRIKVWADELFCLCRERVSDQFEERRLGQRQVETSGAERVLGGPIVAGQGIERVVPRVAPVGHELLQERERHRLTGRRRVGAVFEHPGHRRHVGECGLLRKEQADLLVRVGARFEPPVQLQDEAFAVPDRGVALLHAQQYGRERSGARVAQPRERGGCRGDHVAADPRILPLLVDGCQQRGAEGRVPDGVVQHARFASCLQAGDHGCGPFPLQGLTGRAGQEADRQRVPVRCALGVLHPQQGEHRGRQNRDGLLYPDRADRARLRAEPAPRRDIAGQHCLQRLAGRAMEHRFPRPGRPQCSNGGQVSGVVCRMRHQPVSFSGG